MYTGGPVKRRQPKRERQEPSEAVRYVVLRTDEQGREMFSCYASSYPRWVDTRPGYRAVKVAHFEQVLL